jgi:hypothetical protein
VPSAGLRTREGWLRSAAIGAGRRRWRRTSAWRVLAPRLPTRPLTDDELSTHDHAVLDAVRRLPAAQREVVALHHLADLTVEQVAQTLGTRSATVRTRLASGCESLDGLLAQGQPPSPSPGPRIGHPLCPEDLGRLRAAWYTTKVDARGWIWVLGGGQDGPTTTLFHSSDQGRSWQSHDIGPGAPGELVLAGETMHVVTLGDCAYECIVGGSTSVDHGRTWTSWPAVRNRYLYDLAPGAGDRLFLRTGDTTATARSPQVLVSAQPATGMVDLPAWHLPSPSDDVGLLTSSGSTLWFGRDASTLLRSDDNGQSWTDVPAR